MLTLILVGAVCAAAGFLFGGIFAAPEAPPFPVHEAPDVTGPRLPHHRKFFLLSEEAPATYEVGDRKVVAIRRLPEWQEHERDVDHLEGVSHAARSEAWWTKSID